MSANFYSLVIKYVNMGYSEEDAEILAANELGEEVEED
jgi:hypothetical protein